MTSVWKRLQRVGKRASKFQFVASYHELTVEGTNKWQPDKLRVVWTRRNRRICTKLHGWQPGIKNPYRGTVLWQVPENVDITVTLFKDPNADEFEDKDWTFIIENETKGHRKVLASVDVNMKKYANVTSATFDLTLNLKPLSVKVVDATLKLSLTCIFLKEGKATDEDMQSLASLMSLKHSDIGNLEDFNDSDEEDKRMITGTGRSMAVTESHRQLGILREEEYPTAICPGEENADTKTSNAHQAKDLRSSHCKAGHITTANHKPDGESLFELQIVKPAPRPESMVSYLQSTPKVPSVSEAQSIELPKSDMDVAEKTPSNTASQTIPSSVIVKESTSPLAEVKCTLSQQSTEMQAVFTDKEENLKLQTELTNLHNVQTDENEQEINLTTELTFSPEKIKIDQGAKSTAVFLPFCPRTPISSWSPFTSTCDTDQSQSGVLPINGSTRIKEEVNNLATDYQKSNQDYEAVKNIVDLSECSDIAHSPQFAQVHKAKIKADKSESDRIDFFLSDAKASHVSGFPSGEDIKMEDVQWPKDESLSQEERQDKRINTVAPKDTEYQERHCFEHMREPQLSESTTPDILLPQRSKVDNTKIYREPCMVSILPSCPRAASIPGLPSLYLPEKAIKWLSFEGSIRVMPCKKEPAKHIHNLGIQYHDIKILNKMISLKPTCPKSVSIPGFPSVPLDTEGIPSSVNFLPTCAKASGIAGLPSRLPFTISEPETWPKNNMMLWERKKKKSKVQILYLFTESPDMFKAMIPIRPSYSTASKVPGFPSTPGSIPQEHPSIINMIPSCPKISSITGFPSVILSIEQDLSLC
ncbi:uncharacterized protein ehbp1l1a isoform X4 [Ictalurus furcatus]|uniref:uncharacterized protein ehbp1l1a isoform X4 n=1 Tax=Ictalurus furcatus TaxID=66913 RepID=UPI002350EB23|nr:uncharacterized protein ehbp1l1a isoform X4 [Ictalurus furcatus]